MEEEDEQGQDEQGQDAPAAPEASTAPDGTEHPVPHRPLWRDPPTMKSIAGIMGGAATLVTAIVQGASIITSYVQADKALELRRAEWKHDNHVRYNGSAKVSERPRANPAFRCFDGGRPGRPNVGYSRTQAPFRERAETARRRTGPDRPYPPSSNKRGKATGNRCENRLRRWATTRRCPRAVCRT